MSPVERGFVVLADISGFTAFVTTTRPAGSPGRSSRRGRAGACSSGAPRAPPCRGGGGGSAAGGAGPPPRQVPAVRLQRHPDAAERLETVAEEEVLALGVRGRAPVAPREEGGADLHLAVGRAHVEQARGAGGAARVVAHLGEDDRSPPLHFFPARVLWREALLA